MNNQVNLHLFINNTWTDVTEFINDTVTRANYYDTTFDTAVITLLLKENSIPGISGSEEFQPGLPCYIRYQNQSQTVFYTLDVDNAETLGSGQHRTFKHTLRLVEPSNELRFTKLPSMSFTQPAGEIKLNSSDYRLLSSNYITNSAKDNGPFGTVVKTEPLEVVRDNENLDGNILRQGKTYQINVTYNFKNYAFNAEWLSFPWPFTVSKVKIFGAETETNFNIKLKRVSNSTDYNTLTSSEEITVGSAAVDDYIKTLRLENITTDYNNWVIGNIYPAVEEGTLYFTVTPSEDVYVDFYQETKQNRYVYASYMGLDSSPQAYVRATNRDLETTFTVAILEIDETEIKGNKIMLNEAVEKVLDNINYTKTITQPKRYRLDSLVAGRISSTPISDMQLVNYTAWEALVKLAAEVEAIPYLTGPTFSTVKFLFRDELSERSMNNLLISTEASNINQEDYVRGYSVDIDNLVNDLNISTYIKDPPSDKYYSVRSSTSDASQITEDNAIFILKQAIYDKHQFRFRGGASGGIKIKIKDNGLSATISDNTGKGYWDLTKYILEEKQYLAQQDYPIVDDAERRLMKLQKGNTLYYVKGSNEIKGLGHRPPARPGFIADAEQDFPALVQMFILAAFERAVETGSNPLHLAFEGFENYDWKKNVFTNIEIQAIYPAIVNTNINLYKYNSENSKLDRITSTSTSDYQTSINRLSKYLTSTINEKGNIDYIIDGICSPSAIVPDVGETITINNIKYKVNMQELTYSKTFNRYTLVLAENLVNQNTNVGLNDERRSFEIADTNIVERTDKFRSYIKLISKVDNDNIRKNDNKDSIKYREHNISNKYNNKLLLSKNSIPLFNKDKDYAITSAHLNIKPSNTESDIRLIYPVNSYYLNTTLVFETEFLDNYSAGSTVDYLAVPGTNQNFKGNQPFNYTSALGTINQIDLRLLAGSLSGYTTTSDDLPRTSTAWSNSENTKINLSYNPNKDSREKLKLQAEVTYVTQDPNLTLVFPALAKYSPLLDRSINNGENESIHNITYAYLKSNFTPTLNDGRLDLRNIVKREDEMTPQEKVSNIYGRYIDNLLTTSQSEANAEIYGLRIPYSPSRVVLAVYNKDTLEVLFYHKLEEGVNVDLGVSDLWFVPYSNLTNYVDELSTVVLGSADINVTVRHNPTDASPGAETIFNLDSYNTLNNILLYPQLYTTNISSYPLPSVDYDIINRANGQKLSGDDIIYEDMSIELVYQSGQSLISPVVKSINTGICDEIQLEITNPNPTTVVVEIDYKNGDGPQEYTFSSESTSTLSPVTGFTSNLTYHVELRSKRTSGTSPTYTVDSEVAVESIRMPGSCTPRVSKPVVNIDNVIIGSNVVFRTNIDNYNNFTVTAYTRTIVGGTPSGWTNRGSITAYSGKSLDLFSAYKEVSQEAIIEVYFTSNGLRSEITSKLGQHTVLKWVYLEPAEGGLCPAPSQAMIGTTCSVEDSELIIAGLEDGYPGCIKIKCRKV